MDIKTDGQIYQEVKDMFKEHGGIDYDNRCNINRVRVDDMKEIEDEICRRIENYDVLKYQFKDNIKLLIKAVFNQMLSQSNPHIHTVKDCGFTDKQLAVANAELKCGLLNPKSMHKDYVESTHKKSQSNSPSGLTRIEDESESIDTPLMLGSKSFKCHKCKSNRVTIEENYMSEGSKKHYVKFCSSCGWKTRFSQSNPSVTRSAQGSDKLSNPSISGTTIRPKELSVSKDGQDGRDTLKFKVVKL